MSTRRQWVVTFDVSRDPDRLRLATLLERNGYRSLHSVYDLTADSHEMRDLLREAAPLVRANDHLLALPRCPQCHSAALGSPLDSPTARLDRPMKGPLVVLYDISNDGRRALLRDALAPVADRPQQSGWIVPATVGLTAARMVTALRPLLRAGDRLRVYEPCPT